MRSFRLSCVRLLACGALLASCSDPTGPAVDLVDELFSEIADTWASSTNLVSVSPGVTHLAARPAARTCRYSGTSRRFACPNRVLSGLTFSTSYQLLDRAGVAQAAYDSRTIDAMRTITDVSGTITSASASTTTTLTASDDQVMSGLLSGTHTLNGTATFTTTSESISSSTTMVETTADLVLAARSSLNRYPRSGTITTQVFSGLPVTGTTLLATITSTFDGTQMVVLLIATGALTQTCSLDLTGTTATVCS